MVKHVKVIVEKHPDGYVAYPSWHELPRSKLRGIKPPLADSHGPASLAGELLMERVDGQQAPP